jgi:hypothetical protein
MLAAACSMNEWRAHTQGSSAETRGSSVKQLRCAVCTRQVQRRGGVLAKQGQGLREGLRSLLGEGGKGGPAGGETGQAMAQITGAHKRLFIDAPSSSSAASAYSLSDAPPSVRSYLPTDAPCSNKWIPAPPTRHSSRARGFAAAAEAPRKPSHMPLKSSYSGFFTRRMNVSVDVNASEDRGPPPCARLLSSAACSLARAGAAQ